MKATQRILHPAQIVWAGARTWSGQPARVALTASLAVAVGIAVAFLRPHTYTVSMTVIPEMSGPSSELRALAGALGPLSGSALQVLGSDAASSTPEFIARAARSDTVLLAVAQGNAVSLGKPVYRALNRGGRSHADSVMRAVAYLRRNVIAAETDRRTRIVIIAVRTRDSTLSTVIGANLLAALNEVLVVNRRTAVSNQWIFLQERYEASRKDLETAEGHMRQFLVRNPTYEHSPALVFEYGRLQRQIELAQEILLTVARQLQIAAADEARNKPVLSTLESPRTPTRPDSRRALLFGLAFGGLALAGAIGVRLLDRIGSLT